MTFRAFLRKLSHSDRSWHLLPMRVPLGSDENHGFFRSVVATKADVKLCEIPVNLTTQIKAGQSPLLAGSQHIKGAKAT